MSPGSCILNFELLAQYTLKRNNNDKRSQRKWGESDVDKRIVSSNAISTDNVALVIERQVLAVARSSAMGITAASQAILIFVHV